MSKPGTVEHFLDQIEAEKQAAEHQVALDPATLAQLGHQARKHGIAVGQMIACYVRDGLLSSASRKGSDAYGAIELLLKGVELHLPTCFTFKDKEGHWTRS